MVSVEWGRAVTTLNTFKHKISYLVYLDLETIELGYILPKNLARHVYHATHVSTSDHIRI